MTPHNLGPKVTLVCPACPYTARRPLQLVSGCRGIHETFAEPATCPSGHGYLVRQDQRTTLDTK